MPREIESTIEWRKIVRRSAMSPDRLRSLFQQACLAINLPGDAAELGVYRGGSAMLIGTALRGKRIYAFESFQGLTNLGPNDLRRRTLDERGHAPGDFAITKETERRRIRTRLARAGVQLIEGRFPESAALVADCSFSFAHFDGDTFESATAFVRFFYPRLVRGGRMVFDDSGWPATPGVASALAEASDVIRSPIVKIGQFQALVVKE